MSHPFIFLALITLLASNLSSAQKKWDGGGGTDRWDNALNWSDNSVPITIDQIVFDNSFKGGSYSVSLPSSSITVRSITITPGSGNTITLTLPSQNTSVPALTITGPGYGLTLNSGGIFRNASGSTSGVPVRISDSIRINNGGRYIHNSASGHSTNVQVLSAAPGTEQGIWELDIPTASSTISISGRTYGTLLLRAAAAGGSCNYTAAGTTRVMIRNNLELGAGVTFNLNYSDTIFVKGQLFQEAGTFNLGNSTRSVVLSIQQHLIQSTGGIITETGTGIQTLHVNGSEPQLIRILGSITNQVSFVKDGNGSAVLKNALTLPYKLVLKKGIIASQQLLTLQSGCTIESDSLSEDGYVDGPMKKDGLNNQSFMFPVGKSNAKRWIQLNNATGSFTVEYFKTDPTAMSTSMGVGIHHVSTKEFWDITPSIGSTARVKLSFADAHSGGVTDLSNLRVARLINGTWQNAGNTGFAGSPGSDGWVSSTPASGFSANSKSFALASAIGQENPLPLSILSFNARKQNEDVLFDWEIAADLHIDHFEVQYSVDGLRYEKLSIVKFLPGVRRYYYRHSKFYAAGYYRVIAWSSSGSSIYESKPARISKEAEVFRIAGSMVVSDVLSITLGTGVETNQNLMIYNSMGGIVKTYQVKKEQGGVYRMDVSSLTSGVYFISAGNIEGKGTVLKFVKK